LACVPGEVGLDDLAAKTALITGANQGIGWAIAEELSASGARVVVNYPDESRYPDRLAESGSEAAAVAAGGGKLGDTEGMFGVLNERGIAVKSWSITPASFPY
jgi:NAD(P)-dependent dehydrogenase (short-subunit alcohol dehydrogenase family)